MHSFVEVGEALARIKDEHQYIPAFETFEDYCRERWGIDRSYANHHIAAARAATIAAARGLPAPPTESAARPLAKLLNEAGGYDRTTGELRDPAKGEAAVAAGRDSRSTSPVGVVVIAAATATARTDRLAVLDIDDRPQAAAGRRPSGVAVDGRPGGYVVVNDGGWTGHAVAVSAGGAGRPRVTAMAVTRAAA